MPVSMLITGSTGKEGQKTGMGNDVTCGAGNEHRGNSQARMDETGSGSPLGVAAAGCPLGGGEG